MELLTEAQLNTLQKEARVLLEEHGLVFVVLYGSMATGKTHAESDIDIGFVASTSKTPYEVAQMEFAFKQATGLPAVELRDIGRTSPLFKKTVAENAQLLAERTKGAFQLFRMRAYTQYQSTHSLRQARAKAVEKTAHNV